MVHRIDCRRVLGREIDVVRLVVTIDGHPIASGTRVTFVQVRDPDTDAGKPTGPLRGGILVGGEPQYDVELLSDGVPVAAVGPRTAQTERIYDKLADLDADEAKAARAWANQHSATSR